MKKTRKTPSKPKTKRTPTKNIMLMKSRYALIVKAAKRAGYRVSLGPRSQIGAFITDAALFYAEKRSKKPAPAKRIPKNTPKDPKPKSSVIM